MRYEKDWRTGISVLEKGFTLSSAKLHGKSFFSMLK